MIAYEIETGCYNLNRRIVVAESLAEAEKLFKKENPYASIKTITVLSELVLVQKTQGGNHENNR